jgi:23S rRNA (pseudouridine1915-N3)-methyltransferase
MVLRRLPKDAIVIVLEESGVVRNSIEFSQFLGRLISINREIVCVLGGSAGVHKSLRQAANHIVSLSPLTFTHNFARVLLEEQIYRACTILEGKEYHKN